MRTTAVRVCRNATCTQSTHSTYCSRRCQLTASRNVGDRGQLPDVWVGMDTERALLARCETLGLTMRDLIVNLLEAEAAQVIGWDHLDFGESA